MPKYRVHIENLEDGKQEIFEADDVCLGYTHDSPKGSYSWHFMFHVRSEVIRDILGKVDIQAILDKVNLPGFVKNLVMSKFGVGRT